MALARDDTPESGAIDGSTTNAQLLDRRGRVAAAARFAAVLLLVGVFAAGVRRPRLAAETGLWRREDTIGPAASAAVWPLLVAGAALAALLVILVVVHAHRRRRRRPEDEQVPTELPIPWTAKVLAIAIVLAVIAALGVALWYLLHTSPPPATTPDVGTVHPGTPPPAAGRPEPAGGGDVWWLVVAAVAMVGASLLLRLRAGGAARPLQPTPAPAATPPAGDVLAAGLGALREPADDRDAIIACYVAMERALDRHGVHRGVAQTPTELLARATHAQLVHDPAAAELIELFHRARHSSHPIRPAERRAAERALSVLSEDLAGAR